MARKERSVVLRWALEKGPNTPYRGKDPLSWALSMGNTRLALELLRMGAEIGPHHDGYAQALVLLPEEEDKALEAIPVLVHRLAAQAEAGHLPPLPQTFTRLANRIGDGGIPRLLPLVRPLVLALLRTDRKDLLRHFVLLAVYRSSPEGLRTLAEWGVDLKAFPCAVNAATSKVREKGAEGPCFEVLELLLAHGTSPEGCEDPMHSPPPLFEVCGYFPKEEDALKTLDLLLSHGANPFCKDGDEYATACCRHPKVLRALMNLGVPVEEVTAANARALAKVDLELAVRLVQAMPAEEKSAPLARLLFRVAVLKEDLDERDLLSRLQLFGEAKILPEELNLEGFRGDLKKLLLINSWAKNHGLRLGPGWMSLAISLGADQEALEELMEGREGEELQREAIGAWEEHRPLSSPQGNPKVLPVLVWLSHKVGAARPYGLLEIEGYLRAGGNPDAVVDEEGHTLLQKALLMGSKGLVVALLSHGANPGLKDCKGTPTIHYLLFEEQPGILRVPNQNTEEILAFMVFYGADLEAQDAEGRTLKDLIDEVLEKECNMLWDVLAVESFANKVANAKAFAQEKALEILGDL